MKHLLFKEEAFTIIGKCLEVHKILGPGFLEAVYKDALEFEFKNAGIPFVREQMFDVPYKGIKLKKKYYADFTVYDKIILEAKALETIPGGVMSRAINYLKASSYELCLLVNFGCPSLEFQRIVLQPEHKRS